MLKEDFKNLLNEEYFSIAPSSSSAVLNTYYGIEFRHDWSTKLNFSIDFNQYMAILPQVKQKYARRIERFKRLNEETKLVYFIRIPVAREPQPSLFYNAFLTERTINLDQAISLRNALREYFPSLSFKLVIINFMDQSPNPIGEEDIIEYKFDWGKKMYSWENLFKILLCQ